MRAAGNDAAPGSATLTGGPQLYHWLSRRLGMLRWATLISLLLITVAMPSMSLIGLPNWALVLLFAGYSFVYGLSGNALKHRVSGARLLAFGAILDLLSASLVYFLAGEPGGPLFVLFFFAVNYAAASLTIHGTVLYVVAVAAIATATDFVLLFSSHSIADIRMVFVRLVIIGLVGVGMTILTRRLVTEQKIATSAVNEAMRLEEASKARAYFISSVSHDLGTPLTAARAGLGMVEASALDRLRADEQHLLTNARRNIERLSILLDDLLTFNKLEAGMLQLEREPLDLRLVIMDSMSVVYPLLLQKEQTLEIDLPEPLACIGDARQLEQVVVNLLANAHRHTQPGTRITVSGRELPGEVALSISDNGRGIPQEDLDTIFQRFYRLDPGVEGSGLGLAIAKAVIELHGGKIWAASALGKGASFNVVLPCTREENKQWQ